MKVYFVVVEKDAMRFRSTACKVTIRRQNNEDEALTRVEEKKVLRRSFLALIFYRGTDSDRRFHIKRSPSNGRLNHLSE